MTDNHENEVSEMWKAHRLDIQDHRQKRNFTVGRVIKMMSKEGFEITQFTDYHFRVNDILDIWPAGANYHNIKTGKRGTYREVKDLIRKECA